MRRSLPLVFGALAVLAGLLPFQIKSLSALASEPVSSLELVEAKAFLDQYRGISHSQSPDFYDLYSDRAVVHAHIQGQATGVAFQGRAYKQWGRTLLQSGRAALDGSVFRDATVEQRGDRLVIHAKRYSTTRCYWDPTYLVGIEKEGAAYRIVEERLATNPGARCGASDDGSVAPVAGAASPPVGSGYVGAPTSNFSGVTSSADVPGPSGAPEFHPMSQQEIADTAMRMAQEIAAQYQPQPNSPASVNPPASAATLSLNPRAARPAGAIQPSGSPSALWVTPEE
jgi:hypothetical protein